MKISHFAALSPFDLGFGVYILKRGILEMCLRIVKSNRPILSIPLFMIAYDSHPVSVASIFVVILVVDML